MVALFSENSTNEFRALQIWQILICAARNRQILTYKALANMIGYRGGGVLGPVLGHIAYWCNQNKLPPLTSLVVAEATGAPGNKIPVEDSPAKRESVYEDRDKWFDIIPPSPAEFAEAFRIGRASRTPSRHL